MSTIISVRLVAVRRAISRLFICCGVLAGGACAQINQAQSGDAWQNRNLPAAMDRLKQGNFVRVDIDIIAKAGAVEAIPDLEKQFQLTKDEISKEAIASALVRLGDHDVTYWDYIEKQARAAIESDPPNPQAYDSNGKPTSEVPADLVAWAKAHHVTIDDAEAAATLDLPAKVLFLGQSKDRNAIPLLRQALSSRDVMIRTAAAQGLAELQDKASIPFIVAACRRAPPDEARGIAAFSLARFDDPEAKNAAKEFMPATPAKEAK